MSDIYDFVEVVFGANMHVKRIQSLSNATSDVIESGSLAIHAIGAILAQTNELQRKFICATLNPDNNVNNLLNAFLLRGPKT